MKNPFAIWEFGKLSTLIDLVDDVLILLLHHAPDNTSNYEFKKAFVPFVPVPLFYTRIGIYFTYKILESYTQKAPVINPDFTRHKLGLYSE